MSVLLSPPRPWTPSPLRNSSNGLITPGCSRFLGVHHFLSTGVSPSVKESVLALLLPSGQHLSDPAVLFTRALWLSYSRRKGDSVTPTPRAPRPRLTSVPTLLRGPVLHHPVTPTHFPTSRCGVTTNRESINYITGSVYSKENKSLC